jgi:protoporphyrinogen oxidase
VVVGAGIAGLLVANPLTLGRIGCVVVEARNRTDGAMTSGIAKQNDCSATPRWASGASLTDPARHI